MVFPMQSTIRPGAVALIDVLGFKSACRKFGFEKIFHRMKIANEEADEFLKVYSGSAIDPASEIPRGFHVQFFSDTVAVSFSCGTSGDSPYKPLLFVMLYTQKILASFLSGEPALAFRGCIGCGEMNLEPPIYLGEPYFEVADCHEYAQGAFVWLTPSAFQTYEENWRAELTSSKPLLNERLRLLSLNFEVPCKKKDENVCIERTRILNPFDLNDQSIWPAQGDALLESFDDDVAEKKQATEKLIDCILSLRTARRIER